MCGYRNTRSDEIYRQKRAIPGPRVMDHNHSTLFPISNFTAVTADHMGILSTFLSVSFCKKYIFCKSNADSLTYIKQTVHMIVCVISDNFGLTVG